MFTRTFDFPSVITHDVNRFRDAIKRAFDVVISAFVLIILAPFLGLIAFAICRNSSGPAIYRGVRVGRGGKPFKMLKFRTMKTGAGRLRLGTDGAIHKRADDPRVTRVGRFLRRASLDELPQIWNVLKGEMSLVGPRPELPQLVERYQLWQRKRFAVPQGMTGWWQVNGRSDKPMHLHTEDDLYYVQNYSIGLDLFIILKTFWAVFSGRGAF